MTQDKKTAITSSHLPPPDVWLFSPEHDEPFPTPVDELGMVATDALIKLVKSTVAPEYVWQAHSSPNNHHLYWQRRLYEDDPDAPANPSVFRNLPNNQILLPVAFHNWLHDVTAPPPVPDSEVMYYQIELHRVARSLFTSVKQSELLLQSPDIPEEKLQRGLDYHRVQFHSKLEEARRLPSEFMPIDIFNYDLSSVENIRAIAPRLGELAVRRAVSRVSDVLAPVAA